MPFRPERTSGFRSESGSGRPGGSPDNPLDEMPPEIGSLKRAQLMNLMAGPDHAMKEIKSGLGLEALPTGNEGGYNISVKSGQTGKWHRLDPHGSGFGEFLRDSLEVVGEMLPGVVGAGSAVAASPSGPLGMGVAGAKGAGFAKAGLLGLGQLTGAVPPDFGEAAKGIATEAALGAIPVGGKLAQATQAARGAIKQRAGQAILKSPGIRGEATRMAGEQQIAKGKGMKAAETAWEVKHGKAGTTPSGPVLRQKKLEAKGAIEKGQATVAKAGSRALSGGFVTGPLFRGAARGGVALGRHMVKSGEKMVAGSPGMMKQFSGPGMLAKAPPAVKAALQKALQLPTRAQKLKQFALILGSQRMARLALNQLEGSEE